MDFFNDTKIAEYSYLANENLRQAFEAARNRQTINQADRRLLHANRVGDLRSVNPDARVSWGRAISEQFADRFCRRGSSEAVEPTFLVTLCDAGCTTGVIDRRPQIPRFKSHLRAGLRGLSYLGTLEPAYYSHRALGANVLASTFISWHLHVIVWNVAYRHLRSLVDELDASGKYRPIAEGLTGLDCRKIGNGQLAQTVGYIFKAPGVGYRLAKRTDHWGDLLLVGYSQKRSSLRPGERINLFHIMKELALDELAVAGGEGVAMLRAASKQAKKAIL
jgi:hypothetical protein